MCLNLCQRSRHNDPAGPPLHGSAYEFSLNTKIENNDNVRQRELLIKRAQRSRIHQNVLPEDDPVWPKRVTGNRIYFNDIKNILTDFFL
jgi:hypothetical protein